MSRIGERGPTSRMPSPKPSLADGAHIAHYASSGKATGPTTSGLPERVRRATVDTIVSFATGAALSRVNVYTSLAGPGAEVNLDGLYLVDGNQHIDHQTRIEHVAPNCASREVYKGMLDGAAHGVFNGKVYVHPEAQKTDGKQTNNNLLLSHRRPRRHEAATRDLRRRREVHAWRDGRAARRRRAVLSRESWHCPPRKARTLLTYAFAADVLQRIAQPAVRAALEDAVRERFVDIPAMAVT